MDTINVVNLLRWLFRGIFVVVNNIYCIPTYCVWMYVLSPIRVYSERIFWKIEGQFFYWLLTMVAFWSYSAGYNIIETGDDINPIINEECMVLVNHQSTSDVPLLMAAFSTRNHLLQNLSWIMDGVFKYTNFGIVSILHGDFFIAAGRDKRNATLIQLREYLKKVYAYRSRKWIVLFPEGGFLRKRREAGHRYARRLNLPLLNYVTLPRLGAIQSIMDTIGPNSWLDNSGVRIDGTKIIPGKLKYVIDMTIAYPDGRPLDLGSVIFGWDRACEVRMHYRVFPIADVPSEPDQLQDWTYKRYIEKEALLEYYYRTGIWEPRILNLQPARSSNIAQEHVASPGESEELLDFYSEADIRKSRATPNVFTSDSGANSMAESEPGPWPAESESSTATYASEDVIGDQLFLLELYYGLMGGRPPTMGLAESDELPITELAGPSSAATSGLSNSLGRETLARSVIIGNQTELDRESTTSIDSESAETLQTTVVKDISFGSQETENESQSENEIGASPKPSSYKKVRIVFSGAPEPGRKNEHDLLRIGLVHACFIISTVFHVYAGIWLFDFFANTVFAEPPHAARH